MTIETYAELQAAIGDFLNRTDLAAQIPTFISLNEASINRHLRHWKMEKRSTATIAGKYTNTPEDWIETIRFGEVDKDPLQLMDYSGLAKLRAENSNSGDPLYYAHVAGEFEIYPTPSSAVDMELVYHAKIPALSDTNTSNWLLLESPDVYLYGALTHTAAYLQEDERLVIWGGLYRDALNGINEATKSAKHSGTRLVRRAR